MADRDPSGQGHVIRSLAHLVLPCPHLATTSHRCQVRVRLTKSHSRGTIVSDLGDKTGPLPVEGRLMRYDRARETQRREAEERNKPPPPDVPVRDITEGLRRKGRFVLVSDAGLRMVSSTIDDIDWGPPIVSVTTQNSRYLIEVLRSTETPTDPRWKRG